MGAGHTHTPPEADKSRMIPRMIIAAAILAAFFVVLFVLIAANRQFFGVVLWLFDFSGVPRGLMVAGYSLTLFWSRWI